MRDEKTSKNCICNCVVDVNFRAIGCLSVLVPNIGVLDIKRNTSKLDVLNVASMSAHVLSMCGCNRSPRTEV